MMLAEHRPERVRDLPQRRPGPQGLAHRRKKVFGSLRRLSNRLQRGIDRGLIACRTERADALNLRGDLLVADPLELWLLLLLDLEAVHADDDPGAVFDRLLDHVGALV